MRAFKPQFNFNFAEDMPFYSTSHIYNGIINKEKNEDLDDIRFCDIPWLYNEKNIFNKKLLFENNNKKDLLRFIALGMDSIKIIRNIDKLELNKNKFLPGDTGYLQLDEFNKIRRDFVIVKFKNGKAKKFLFKKMLDKKHIKYFKKYYLKNLYLVSQVIVGHMVMIIAKFMFCQNVFYLQRINSNTKDCDIL